MGAVEGAGPQGQGGQGPGGGGGGDGHPPRPLQDPQPQGQRPPRQRHLVREGATKYLLSPDPTPHSRRRGQQQQKFVYLLETCFKSSNICLILTSSYQVLKSSLTKGIDGCLLKS